MKKLLITGGAGFIGSNFIKYMLDKYDDYYIVNFDKLTYAGNLFNLNEISNHERYEFVHGCITDEKLVNDVVKNDVDIIINFAAETHVDNSILSPKSFVTTNVIGTQVLLEAARMFKIERYIQISTDEVYGSLGLDGFFHEESNIDPSSPYSASKAAGDMLVMSYYRTYSLPINITRCSNNYGAYQYPEKLIPLMISHALGAKKLPVYGDGLQIRDWLHVIDHCSAIDSVLQNGKPGEIYNIGGNCEKTNIEIVKFILNYLGKNEDLIMHVKDRLGHDRRYAIDSSKIKETLKWKPNYSFEKGLSETIEWYINNQDWLKSLNNRY